MKLQTTKIGYDKNEIASACWMRKLNIFLCNHTKKLVFTPKIEEKTLPATATLCLFGLDGVLSRQDGCNSGASKKNDETLELYSHSEVG